jgi:hypothetical protein
MKSYFGIANVDKALSIRYFFRFVDIPHPKR